MNDPCISSQNNNLDFVLSYLDKTCSLDTNVEVYDNVYEPTFTYDAIAEYIISASIWKQIFQIQINDFNLNEVQTNDVKYIINSTSLDYLYHTTCETPLGENAIVTNNTAIGQNTILNSPYLTQCINHDYVRYLAKSLFNTSYATSLFLNRSKLIASVGSAVNGAWFDMYKMMQSISDKGTNSKLSGSSGFKYLTDNEANTYNICREIYLQLISQKPERFKLLQNTTMSQCIPIMAGDTICIRITINPCNNQTIFGGDPIQPRKYVIKFILT
jgi:hypothetical protein